MAGEAPAGKSLRFSQAQRLQRSWEFERTRLEGQRIVKGCLILNWRSADSEKGQGTPRLGVVTSRKIGNAVARQSIAQKLYAQVELDFIAAARQAKLVRGTS